MIRIRKPRGLSTFSLLVAVALGTVGGFYIYRPLLIEQLNKNKSKKDAAANEPNSSHESGEIFWEFREHF